MSQVYLQRFEYRGVVDKAAFDAAWAIGYEALAKTGNFGNVEKGVRHIRAYGTAWGG